MPVGLVSSTAFPKILITPKCSLPLSTYPPQNHNVTQNTYAFPEGVPYVYRINPDPLKFVWNALVNWEQNVQGREMIYSIGYRGLNDYGAFARELAS